MANPISLTVNLGSKSYPIRIGEGLLTPGQWATKAYGQIFIVTDDNVGRLYGEKIENIFAGARRYIVPAGETSKSMAVYGDVTDWLIGQNVRRGDTLVAFGGGVVGDLAGFAAATILRGIRFIQIPTSLLAQVDSSVGGKTGINSPRGKNLIGAFHQPKEVVIDVSTLDTLSDREMKAGYAEVVKYGLLGDAEFFEWLEVNGAGVLERDPILLTRAIEQSCRMKAMLVSEDEFEQNGRRALLNLGHTFAHALENACAYDGRLLHGEAVGIGLVLAARLSQRLGLITERDEKRIAGHLTTCGLMTEIRQIQSFPKIDASALFALMQQDKKNTAQGIAFIVLNRIGTAVSRSGIEDTIIMDILKDSME